MKRPIPPNARAVFFDAVGTLIAPNPPAPAVYAEHARRHGAVCDSGTIRVRMVAAFAVEEEIDRAAGWVTSDAREEERWRRIVAASLTEMADTDACFRDLFEHFARPDAWAVNPDAPPVVARLATAGVILGLASNYDSRLLRVLAGLPELAPVADRVLVSSLFGRRKPSPHFFREMVRMAGYPAGDVVYVGDDYANDYLGATGAGLSAVLLDARGRYPTAVRITRLSDLLGP